mgnify:CR=1 FL=1
MNPYEKTSNVNHYIERDLPDGLCRTEKIHLEPAQRKEELEGPARRMNIRKIVLIRLTALGLEEQEERESKKGRGDHGLKSTKLLCG